MRQFSTKEFKVELKKYVSKRNQRIAKRIYQKNNWNDPQRVLYRQNYSKTYNKEHYNPKKIRGIVTF